MKREHLDTTDVFILELDKQVSIWIGKKADPEEKKNALIIGKSFVKAHNKPKGTRVTRIVENAEDTHFKSFFNGFYPILKQEHGHQLGYDESITQNQDFDKLANKKREMCDKLITKLGDSYKVKVYQIGDEVGENPVEIPEEEYGHFFQSSVYMIDVQGTSHRYIIQWFGPRLPSDVQSNYRKFADILTGGVHQNDWTRTTVMQGHEDDTLLTFFPNGFVCHDGPRASMADR